MSVNAIIIGSGFSSLSAACYLAKAGYEVIVLEKNDQPGGRARKWCTKGFTFDMGPSWYWMPDVFEQFYGDFFESVSDYYLLSRLDPSYRIYFGKKIFEDIPSSQDGLYRLFEKYQPGSTATLKDFLHQAEITYKLAVKEMAFKPGHSIFEFVSAKTISYANLFIHSLSSQLRSKFTHPYLISLLEFPVLFLGAKPSDIPAFYNFMNYADLAMGTWYPAGGMYAVVEGIVKLAAKLGVRIIPDCNVEGLEIIDSNVRTIKTSKGDFTADIVISGADYAHTESLLPVKFRNYSDAYWKRKTFAPSALLFFIGLDKKLKNIRHHNLFFDKSFDQHAGEIYDHPKWPEQPLFYANIPSVTDVSVAPEGHECMTILIPVAPGLEDSPAVRAQYREMIIQRFEEVTGEEIRSAIMLEKSYCIDDFVSDYNSYKGNAYGLANTFFQTGYFRPSIRNKKVDNLFYTGQLTVPGGGVPSAIISGKIVANDVIQKIRKHEYAN